MKKILFSLYIVIFLLSFLVFADITTLKQEESMKQAGKENGFIITIDQTPLTLETDQFLSKLFSAADHYKANIFKPYYSDESSIEYIYLTHNTQSYFSNFPLINGQFPSEFAKESFNLSTLQAKRNTGTLFSYSNQNKFTIKPLKEFPKDKPITGTYIVTLHNKNEFDSFKKRLQIDLGISIEDSDYTFQSPIKPVWLKISPIIILYVLSLLVVAYYYFFEYKNTAIRLLNGYSGIHIWKKYFREIFSLYFIAAAISTVVMAVIVARNLLITKYWLLTVAKYSMYQILGGIVLCLVMSFPFFRVNAISIPESIKNQKPLKHIQFTNGATKIIFSIIILYLLFFTYFTLSDYYRYYKINTSRWEELKNYGIMPTRAPLPNGSDPKATLELFDKHYKLFKHTNDQGAILIQISDVYKAKQAGIKVQTESKYEEHILLMNNNYLKLNPLKTSNNKPFYIDENSEELTVLVPEKYQNEEKELRKFISDDYYFNKYEVKNSFLKELGRKLSVNENNKIKLIWIKNGQSFFTFSTKYAKGTNNHIYDGIGYVLTNKNGNEGAWYDTVVGNDGYFIKLTDQKLPYNSIKDKVHTLGLQKVYPFLFNAYDVMNNQIHTELKTMYLYLTILVVILLVYFSVSIFTTIIYLEQYKYRHTVQTIHGYSFFHKHQYYFILSNVIWILMIAFTIVKKQYSFGSLIFVIFMLECTITYLILKIREGKKLLQILKEG